MHALTGFFLDAPMYVLARFRAQRNILCTCGPVHLAKSSTGTVEQKVDICYFDIHNYTDFKNGL